MKELTPEQKLVMAVVEQALRDAILIIYDDNRKFVARNAIRYMCENSTEPWSWNWCLDVLGIDWDYDLAEVIINAGRRYRGQ